MIYGINEIYLAFLGVKVSGFLSKTFSLDIKV